MHSAADSQSNVAMGKPTTASCVQDIDVRSSLQFTSVHTVCCTLHRHTSRITRTNAYEFPTNHIHTHTTHHGPSTISDYPPREQQTVKPMKEKPRQAAHGIAARRTN
ncbi:hypothetical protein Ciccas_012789, partial [Cichlidogyrus casuarinus]